MYNIHPDFTVQLSSEFMDSAELTSEDPQTVVYKIKQNAVWSDGTPVTADDFIFWWENCNETNKKADCVSTTGYKDIESVEGSDGGKTVTTVYKNKFADWKSLFSQYIIPAHYTKAQPGGWNTGLDKNPEKIPSAGPFVVESYTPGQSLTLKRNDKYYGTKSHLDKIVFRYLPESTTQPAALQNNEVDMIYGQPQLDQVQIVKAIPDVTSEINFGLQYEHLDFNVKNPLLADVAVRKAFATGLNIQQIVDRTVKQFSDKATILGNRFWMNNQPEYQDHRGAYGNGDIAAAEKLLTDAGYAKGADGIFAKGGKRLSVNISTTRATSSARPRSSSSRPRPKSSAWRSRSRTPRRTSCSASGCPRGTSTSPTSPGWPRRSRSRPTSRSSPPTAPRTTASSPTRRSTSCSRRPSPSSTRRRRPSWATRSTSSCGTRWPPLPLYQKPQLIGWRNTFTGIGDNLSSQGPFWNAGTWAQKAA